MSSDSDSEDEAQMRQFQEAADHTLLTNAMYQEKTTAPAKEMLEVKITTKPLKSERQLDEQAANAAAQCDLQISEQMQTHMWRKLSSIIQEQVEFCDHKVDSSIAMESSSVSQVKLVSDANCYLSDTIIDTGPKGPQKKPNIKKRQLKEEVNDDIRDISMLAVSGESIMAGVDTTYWAKRVKRKDKYFEYVKSDKDGFKLKAIVPSNEFTALRRKNGWNETKIRQKNSNKKKF